MQQCTLLKQLGITHANISDAVIIELSYHCPLLEALDLSDCVLISDVSVVAVTSQCRALEVVDVFQMCADQRCIHTRSFSILQLHEATGDCRVYVDH